MYGIHEAAKQAGISEEQLASWIKSGKVEPTEELTELTGTGKYLFDEAAIKHIHQLAQVEAGGHAVEHREKPGTFQPGIKHKRSKP